MNRRTFLSSSTLLLISRTAFASEPMGFEVTRSEAEWRAMLTDLQYAVMRENATEPAGSSPLNELDAEGLYHCRGCDLPLYSSDTKYESGTGWPSFWQSLPDAIRTKEDRSFIFQLRTAASCRRCGSHLGHIFDDGPPPTGKRHCLNGVSLFFVGRS